MTAAIKSLVSVFEEEFDKQSELNAKASFLLCQVIEIFRLNFKFLLNLFLFLLALELQ